MRTPFHQLRPVSDVQPTLFGPFKYLGRTPFHRVIAVVLSFLTLATIFVIALPEASILTWMLIIVWTPYGYLTYRRRSPSPIVQKVQAIVPVLFAITFMFLTRGIPFTVAAFTVIPAIMLGRVLGHGIERILGPTDKVLKTAWAGVTHVGSSLSGGIRFDVTPLTSVPTQEELRDMQTQVPASGLALRSALLKWLFLIIFPIIIIAMFTGFIEEIDRAAENRGTQLMGFTSFIMLLVTVYGVLGWYGFRGTRHATTVTDHVRYAKFAKQNGFDYTPGPVIDDQGRNARRLMTTFPPQLWWSMGNASNPTATSEATSLTGTFFSGFCELDTGVDLPNLVLTSKRLRLPSFARMTAPRPGQQLSLEGDFDRHFTLYCPKGYEQDALYILTPDVMAHLIDGARGFDVEFIDRKIILRSSFDMVSLDPSRWQHIAEAMTLLTRRLQQWQAWRDDRLLLQDSQLETETPSGVALAGRRLRLGLSLGAVLGIAYLATYLGLIALSNAL